MFQAINFNRLAIAVAAIAIVATAGFLSTRAFFSDTETSAGNVFAAGSLDLMVGIYAPQSLWPDVAPRNNNNQQLFAINNIMPGEKGEGYFRLLSTEDSWACMSAELTAIPDNTRLSQEESAGDTTPNIGELQDYMQIAVWETNAGNNDGLVGPNEVDTLKIMSLADFTNGEFVALQDSVDGDNPLVDGTEYQHEFAYCLGEFVGTPGNMASYVDSNNELTCDGGAYGSEMNRAQTDGVELLMSFYAEQSTNNANFICSSVTSNNISQSDLATGDRTAQFFTSNWFFYNDTDDTLMTENQFAVDGGENTITTGPDSVSAAKMVLHDATARYNIATYAFRDLLLSDVDSLTFRVYDASVNGQSPFIHFNVDFNNSDTWQRRLVHVPTVTPNTWTVVDAYQGGAAMWTLSGGNWPAGAAGQTGSTPGSTPLSWNDIVANYPNVQTRNTDAFFGVRVGHPGPDNETSYVDYINVDGEVINFGN